MGLGQIWGAGVLVYGTCKIGEGACIGASSSIVRAVIGKGAIVPPCSLISGLEQSAVEKEASPAIAQELEISKTYTSPTNHSFTHTYSSAQPLANNLGQAIGFNQANLNGADSIAGNDNIVERSTTETYVHTSLTATPESVIANSVERTVTETQVEITTDAIADQGLETVDVLSGQANPAVNPLEANISTLATANSAQAKAHAQSQINRFIKRLYPQN